MATLLAIAVTAVVVGLAVQGLTRRLVRRQVNTSIGGRAGADPVDEHRRMLDQAARSRREADTLARLLTESLDMLTSGVVLRDSSGVELVRNRLAADASTRPHERTLVDATIDDLVALAIEGGAAEREIEVSGPPRRTLVVHAVPITVDDRVVGALAMIDDVTDHHRMEKTRRDFVANLGHELRTPVGALSLLAEMVVDEHDPETRARLSESLIAETDRMTATIDDLLELSRIESESQDYDEPVDVRGLLDEAVARTRVAADARRIEIGTVAPADAITFRGNRDQLVSALVNLVDNAIKYSDEGDSVSVRARVDGDLLSLVVQDTGRGIPARDIDRIFERFYRVDRSRDSTTGGTGIGLAIVRHVALNHGGSVAVDSFEGEGSTFTIELPLVDADRRAARADEVTR